MEFVADLHLHSKYSRAVSQKMNLEELDKFAQIKGISVLGTADFTHPKWFEELSKKLEPAEPGFFKLKKEYKLKETKAETRFVLSVEISSIYSWKDKVRRIHNVVILPTLEAAKKLNNKLSFIGNLASDGRPILGLSSKDLLKVVFDVSEEALFIPAHIWTPWFSLFGSMSGFNSLKECFEEYSNLILAVETGLSSDPQMNWRISELDNYAIVSNSDSHSLEKIGREATVFNGEFSLKGIIKALKNSNANNFNKNNDNKIAFTIEFFPEEGKYHYDGHRLCGVSFSPQESLKHKNICPKCGKPLTIGVMNRVEELSDRPFDFFDSRRPSYKKLVPLDEIIADALGVGNKTKSVLEVYKNLILNFKNELNILLNAPISEIKLASNELVALGIERVREGKIHIFPGYDGEYGKIFIFTDEERLKLKPQKTKNTLF
jgi:uncharacterized protein (TIGR00375 family)